MNDSSIPQCCFHFYLETLVSAGGALRGGTGLMNPVIVGIKSLGPNLNTCEPTCLVLVLILGVDIARRAFTDIQVVSNADV